VQGQEVRRANSEYEAQLEADKAALERLKAEGKRLKAEGEWIESNWRQIPEPELSAARNRVLAKYDELIREKNELNRKWDDLNRTSDQVDANWDRYEERSRSVAPALMPPPSKNDCLIVATETYARLKNTAYWARIAGFDFASRDAPGHAVVLFQPAQGSTVWLYDAAGSRDLGIKSHNLSELKEAISGWLKGNARVSDIRWIGEERGLSSEEEKVGDKN
jgi:hypothetical protein